MDKKGLVHVGTFGQPQGLKGDIKINIFTLSLESFQMLKSFFMEDELSSLIFTSLRKIGKKNIGSIEGCKDRNAALKFKGKHIFAFRKNFPKTNNNEYYVLDLIGCKVINMKKESLGNIIDIKNFGAGNLMEIKNNSKKTFYIPMNKDNLINVDINKKKILVNPIKGLLERC